MKTFNKMRNEKGKMRNCFFSSIIFLLSPFCFLLSSCNNNDIVPDNPDTPTTGYHFTIDTGTNAGSGSGASKHTRASWDDSIGSGNLLLKWDYTPENEDGDEVVFAFCRDKFLASMTGEYFTYAKIKKHDEYTDDAGCATFTTIEEYSNPMESGAYDGHRVIALTPLCKENGSSVECDADNFVATLPMPGTFEQKENKEPAFLRDYMYMYTEADIADGCSTVEFFHIPATFRFKVTNKRPTPATINSVKVTVVDADGVEQPVASEYVNFFVVSGEAPEFAYSETSYKEVTTVINANLDTEEKFIAYALVLPLAGDAPLQGKKIRFYINASNPDNEYLAFELDAKQLSAANPNGEYNWVGDKSYTINMSLEDVIVESVGDINI